MLENYLSTSTSSVLSMLLWQLIMTTCWKVKIWVQIKNHAEHREQHITDKKRRGGEKGKEKKIERKLYQSWREWWIKRRRNLSWDNGCSQKSPLRNAIGLKEAHLLLFEHSFSNRTSQCPNSKAAYTSGRKKKLPVNKKDFGEITHAPCKVYMSF